MISIISVLSDVNKNILDAIKTISVILMYLCSTLTKPSFENFIFRKLVFKLSLTGFVYEMKIRIIHHFETIQFLIVIGVYTYSEHVVHGK